MTQRIFAGSEEETQLFQLSLCFSDSSRFSSSFKVIFSKIFSLRLAAPILRNFESAVVISLTMRASGGQVAASIRSSASLSHSKSCTKLLLVKAL